jgi:hypothetical protein
MLKAAPEEEERSKSGTKHLNREMEVRCKEREAKGQRGRGTYIVVS